MVKTIDKERLYGKYYKHKQSIIDFFYRCRYRTSDFVLYFSRFN